MPEIELRLLRLVVFALPMNEDFGFLWASSAVPADISDWSSSSLRLDKLSKFFGLIYFVSWLLRRMLVTKLQGGKFCKDTETVAIFSRA